jgi:flagellar export protein FliJ
MAAVVMMTELHELQTRLERARREEKRSFSDLVRCEHQVENQRGQLEHQLAHRDQCVSGLASARESGLSIVQMREYQLLLQHINKVVHEQQEKVHASEAQYEAAREAWEQRQQQTVALNDELEALLAARVEPPQLTRSPADDKTKAKPGMYTGITGKRLKTT